MLAGDLRGGYRLTPVNWHLNADEVEYIINDCEAKALFAETRYPSGLAAKAPALTLKVSIGERRARASSPTRSCWRQFDGADIADPTPGSTHALHLRHHRPAEGRLPRATPARCWPWRSVGPSRTTCSCAPGPPTTPRRWPSTCARRWLMGIPLVFIDRWDSEGVLKTIEKYKVTRTPPGADHVPAAAQPAATEVRAKYDVSSLRYIIHGAAPCPPEVKKAMIDWVGPILNEYYAGSEGGAGFIVSLRGVADEARHGRQAARPQRAPRSSTTTATR